MMSDASAAAAHAANILAAEQLRQRDIGPAAVQNNSGVGTPAVLLPSLPQTARTAIDVAFYRRCLASAIANGASPAVYLQALRSLGASMYQ
jgi:hypothetical protein